MTTQNPADKVSPAQAFDDEAPAPEEAARYALLQRLAPALQHHMMGQFQSMGMIAAMMEKRLESNEPDMANIRKDCAALGSVSQTAINSIINLMTWIEPKPRLTVTVDAGVKECVGLLATQFRFKGFAIVNEVPPLDLVVSSAGFRSVLSATLIVLSDLSQVPADLVIQAQAVPGGVELSIGLRATERSQRSLHSAPCRLMKWRDVEVLAAAETVRLTHGADAARLVFTEACEDLDPRLANRARNR